MSKDYKKVLDIYNKLPKEQQLYVAPSGKFVDSPRLLDRYILERQKGFIEAYKTSNPSEAFVTLAVSPEFRGQGLGKKLINESLLRLKDKGIRNIIYKVDNKNKASKALAQYFNSEPDEVTEDYSIYKIPVLNNSNASKDLFYAPIIKDVIEKYNKQGYNLLDTNFNLDYIPRYNNNKPAYNFNLPAGGSYVSKTGDIILHPNIEHVMSAYGIKDKDPESFAGQLIAHELAHKIDDRYLTNSKRQSILDEALNNKFNTPYLEMVSDKNKELLAEYISSKL